MKCCSQHFFFGFLEMVVPKHIKDTDINVDKSRKAVNKIQQKCGYNKKIVYNIVNYVEK